MTKAIYPLVAGALPTVTTTAFDPSTQTQFGVESLSSIPTPTNHLTIRSGVYFVTVEYTTATNNTISGVTYVEGDVNHIFPIGATVMRTVDKYDFDAITENINTKVSQVEGKTLSTNDYSNADKAIVTGVTAQLATKVDKATGYSLVQDAKVLSYDAHLANTSNPHGVTKTQIGLSNVDNTADLSKPISTATQTALDAKVDKVTGKGLSSEDYTSAEKTKLAGIATGAEVNVNADWNAVSGDAQILNKPSKLPNPSALSFTGAITDSYDGSSAKTINIPTQLPSTWGSITGTLSNQTDLNTALNNKQAVIDSTNKLSADLVNDLTTTNKFVTSAEKATWNAKQNALTFDNVPTDNSNNPVKSNGIYDAIQTVQTDVNTKVKDVKLNGVTVLNSNKEAILTTVDNLTSTSQTPLSANQGKILSDRIDAISSLGRYLSHWNCATGLSMTNPPSSPYTYHTGDYFVISIVSQTVNYMPNGSTYTTGVPSTTVTTEPVAVNDIWRYDGTSWQFELNHAPQGSTITDVTVGGQTVVTGGVAVIPTANSTHTGALSATDWSTFNNKQNALTIEQSPSTSTTAVVSSNGVRTALSAKQDTLTAGTNITINSGTISVTGSSTPVSAGTTLFTTGGAYTELDKKVDKVSGKGLSENDYTTAEKNKLAGIANGAEVNVNADWNAVSGDAQILNKPTSMTPTIHASTHATGGTDAITPSSIGAQSAITSASKLSSDLVSDSGATNKFVSAIEKATWSGKQDTMSGGTNVSITGGTTINVAGDANAPTANGTTLATTGNLYQRIRYGTSAQRTASSPRTGDVWIEIS